MIRMILGRESDGVVVVLFTPQWNMNGNSIKQHKSCRVHIGNIPWYCPHHKWWGTELSTCEVPHCKVFTFSNCAVIEKVRQVQEQRHCNLLLFQSFILLVHPERYFSAATVPISFSRHRISGHSPGYATPAHPPDGRTIPQRRLNTGCTATVRRAPHDC